MKTKAAIRKNEARSFTSGSAIEKCCARTGLPRPPREFPPDAGRAEALPSGNLILIATFMNYAEKPLFLRRRCGAFRYLRCHFPGKILETFGIQGARPNPRAQQNGRPSRRGLRTTPEQFLL